MHTTPDADPAHGADLASPSWDAGSSATLAALVDRVFPATADSPGAVELGVLDYVRRYLASPVGQGAGRYRRPPFHLPQDSGHGQQHPYSPAETYRLGLAALDEHCRAVHGAPFPELPPAAQEAVVGQLAAGELTEFREVPGPVFFALVREHVVEGLFADPAHGGNRQGAGWRWLGYPGPPALETDLGTGTRLAVVAVTGSTRSPR